MALAAVHDSALSDSDAEQRIARLMDDLRVELDQEMSALRPRHQTYLRWYSPPYNELLRVHDSWLDPVGYDQIDSTRDNFPLCRAVVDLWSSLEAAKPPTVRAEAERIPPPMPMLLGEEQERAAAQYDVDRRIASVNSDIRSARIRRWMGDDLFALKHHRAVRRKNLYGFSWMRVLPQPWNRRSASTVLRNGTTVYPLWSNLEDGELEAVFSAQLMSARQANARWPGMLPIQFDSRDPRRASFERGYDSGSYRDINENRWFDHTRTMVWVEELWWLDRRFDRWGRVTESVVHWGVRVMDRVVDQAHFVGWTKVPFVYWENTDERDSWGWSDIAGVIDINDEFNRRISQQGDVIRLFSAPRYQLLGSLEGRQVDMPAAFQMIPLTDTERIEQILTRIDVYPTQAHFDVLTDLLHRVSGLPPIVWGLISNAQTSGRALSASWKATEARLLPKLMRNEASVRQYLSIVLDQARYYDWYGAKEAFKDRDGFDFDDFKVTFPPMEPRDFTEVTMDEITKRDAGLTTSVRAARAIGTEDAEDMMEEVRAENQDIDIHPDKVNARLLAERAALENEQFEAQLQQPPAPPPGAAPPQGPQPQPGQPASPEGYEGPLPPTQQGAPGNAGAPMPGESMLTGGTLVRNGEASTQLLNTVRF